MKKILFCIPNLSHGGAEKVLVNLINHMNDQKFDITVFTLFDVGVNKKFLNNNIRYKFLLKRMFRGNIHFFKLFSPKILYNMCIKEHYDIIISYLEGSTARMVSGCTDKNTKLVSWIHVEQQNKKIASKAFRSYNEALNCYKKFNKIICVSNAVMDDFQMLFGKFHNISVLYNTVESDYIREKSREPIGDIKFTEYKGIKFCGVGKITKRKGFMRLAHIHKRMCEKGYEHKFYILGLGKDQPRIEKYLKENRLENSFIFLGYDENPYKYLARSDAFVCSSLSEGFSTAATEALIVGTPVITTLCAGMKEMLGENNEYGIVTENSESSLEEGIELLLKNPDILINYKEKARQRGKIFETAATVKAVEDMLYNL